MGFIIFTLRFQDLGPIKRPLTTSIKSSIINTLKQSVKLKLDKTPTSRSLSKLLKTGIYALVSLRRGTFLLIPTNFDGRIARNPREKSHSLSLKSQISSFYKLFSLPHVFSPFQFEDDDTIHYFVLLSFNYSPNAFKSWISDIWHYLGRPFPSSLYSCNMCHMSTCYV